MKKISAVLLSVLLVMNFFVVYPAFAAETNKVGIDVYFESDIISTAFVGENLKAVYYLEDTEEFDTIDIAVGFNPDVVKIASFVDNSVTDTVTLTALKYSSLKYGSNGSYGVIGSEYLVDNWDGYTFSKAVIDNDNGFVRLVPYNQETVAMPQKTSVFEFNFLVIAEGNPEIRFVKNETNLTGCVLARGGPPLELSIAGFQDIIVKNAPDVPADLTWNESDVNSDIDSLAKWSAGASRGYEVNLYKNSVKIKTLNLPAGTIEYDFSEEMATPGTYYFAITALGGAAAPVTVKSEDYEVIIKLDKPEAPIWWTGKIISWNSIENADYYFIELFKAGTAEAVYSQNVIAATSLDLSAYITLGDYTVTVTAKSNNGYLDSDPSAVSEIFSTGSTVSGTVRQEMVSDSTVYNNGIKIALIKNSIEEFSGLTSANGEFTIEGVTAGTYTVKISRAGALTMTVNNFVVEKNESKKIKDNTIVLIQGDIYVVDNLDAISASDLSNILPYIGTVGSSSDYEEAMDFNFSGIIDIVDLTRLIVNYDKTAADVYNN